MKRFNVSVAAIEPGMFITTGLASGTEFDRHINKAFEKVPQYVKDHYGETVINKCKYKH